MPNPFQKTVYCYCCYRTFVVEKKVIDKIKSKKSIDFESNFFAECL